MSAAPPPVHSTSPACRECGGALSAGGAGGICARCIVAEMQALPQEETGGVPRRHMGGYELLECIGRGGMGTVYRARHTVTGQERALKMLTAGELAAPGARRRFLQEAEAAAGLQHPHIVTLHEAGMQDGMPFYVMDCLPGRTLAEAVKDKPMPAHAAAACMAHVASAMQHAHSRGVLHRDLKPSNILLDELGEPRVADFGLARQMDAASSLTGTRQIMGSPPYMSPEQASGGTGKVSAASDVYALGAVLYHLLTGRAPFAGETPQAVLRHVTEDEPLPPRRIMPSIPRELETITLKCLEKSPARRYASAAELEADLLRFLEGAPVLARPVSTAARWWRRARRYPAVTALSLLLIAGAAAGLGFILHKNRELTRSDADKTTALTEKDATLAESLLWQAEFQRLTGKPGQREGSLDAVRSALRLPLTADQRLRARNAAIAALALPDAAFVPSPSLPVPAGPAQGLVSRNGMHYAWIMPDGKVQILRPDTGEILATHDPAPRRVDALLEWSHDASMLAWRCKGTRLGVCHWRLGPMLWTRDVWDRADLALLNQVDFRPISGQEIFRPWFVIHPERDGSISIREVYTSVPWRSVPPPEGPPPQWSAIRYSVARDLLAAACGSRPEIVIYDMSVRPPRMKTLECQAIVHSLDWENAENWLLAGDVTGRITAWDARTWESQPPFEGHSQPVNCTMTGAAHNFRHISAGADGTIRLWDRGALRPVLTLPGQANRFCFQSSEMRAGPVIRDGRNGWYELRWSPIFHTLNPPEMSEGSQRVAWIPDGGIFACLTGHAAVIFRRSGGMSHTLVIPMPDPTGLTFTPGGRLLLIAAADGLHAVSIARGDAGPDDVPLSQGSPLPLWLTQPCQDVSFAMRLMSRMAVLHRDGTLNIHSLDPDRRKPGEITHTFHVPPRSRCVLSPDGRWLATGSLAGNDAALTDLNSKQPPEPLPAAQEARAWLPAFSNDSRLLAWSGHGAVLMDPEKPASAQRLPVPPNESSGRGAVFIPTRDTHITWLAIASADEEVYLFETGSPCRHFATLRAPTGGRIGDLAIGRTGRLVCALPRGEVQMWSLAVMRHQINDRGLSWTSSGD